MRWSLLILVVLLPIGPRPAHAQEPGASERSPANCPKGRISIVFVDNHSIFDTGDPDRERRFDWAYRLANALHVRTREAVIERELLVRPGDCYDELRLRESERLLREYPFLSRVDIFGIPQADSTHHVVVDTQDEWSTRVDLRVALEDGLEFEGIRLREINLIGTGRSLEFFYTDRGANGDYGVAYETPQLFRSRWDMSLAAGRTRAGTFFRESVAYPFVGELGRWAAKQSVRRQDRFFDYELAGAAEEHLLLPVAEDAVEVAVIGRSGDVGRMTTFGVALSYIGLDYPGGPDAIEHATGDDFAALSAADPASIAAIRRQLTEVSSLRGMLLIGRRNIGWIKRRGLDAMRGIQDVRLGSEVELALGRTLPGIDQDHELYAGLVAYGGSEIGDLLLAGELRADGRRAIGSATAASGWNDYFADAEILAYWRPSWLENHTLVLRGTGAGGWQTFTPFQLTLGGEHGVRGYARHRFPGGRRIVVSAEDRVYFGWPFPDVLDLGGTVFFDAGRMWPGDAPFGLDSGWRAAAGFGLRGAFPAGGRTTYRIDLAWPVSHGASWRDARLIISIGELIGLGAEGRGERYGDNRQLRLTGEAFHFPR